MRLMFLGANKLLLIPKKVNWLGKEARNFIPPQVVGHVHPTSCYFLGVYAMNQSAHDGTHFGYNPDVRDYFVPHQHNVPFLKLKKCSGIKNNLMLRCQDMNPTKVKRT